MNKLESACYLAEADEAPFDKLHEECGVFGIYRADSANKRRIPSPTQRITACLHFNTAVRRAAALSSTMMA